MLVSPLKVTDLLSGFHLQEWVAKAEFAVQSDSKPCCDIVKGAIKPFLKDTLFW